MGAPPSLFELCIDAAASNVAWRLQRRSLERLPEHAANLLLSRLVQQQALGGAPQLELWKGCASCVDLSPMQGVTAEHITYLAEYADLRQLGLARCPRLRDHHLAPLVSLRHCLRHLDFSGCQALTGRCMDVVGQLQQLISLDLSGTAVGPPHTRHLSQLTALTSLALAQLPLTDQCALHLAHLTRLAHLDLHGAASVGDAGLLALEPALGAVTFLDLTWTGVTLLPLLPSLQVLRMEHCHIEGAWEAPALQAQPHTSHTSTHSSHYRQPRGSPGHAPDPVNTTTTTSRGSGPPPFLPSPRIPLQQLHLAGCTLAAPPAPRVLGGQVAQGVSWGGPGNDAVHKLMRAGADSLRIVDLQGAKAFTLTGWPQPSLDQGHAGCPGRSPYSSCEDQSVVLKALSALDLRGTGVHGDTLCVLQAVAPQLRCLLMAECTGLAGTAQLPGWCLPPESVDSRFSRLKRLDLSWCGLTDAHLPSLQQLTCIQQLDLANNPLTGSPPPPPEPPAGPQGPGLQAAAELAYLGGQAQVQALVQAQGQAQGQGAGRNGEGGGVGQGAGVWLGVGAPAGHDVLHAADRMAAVWRNTDDPRAQGGPGGALGAAGVAPPWGWECMSRLTSLNLRGTEYGSAGIKALAPLADSLTHLELGSTGLTGEAVRHVTGLTRLCSLSLCDSPLLTGHDVARVVRGLPLLTRLELPGSWLVSKSDLAALLRGAVQPASAALGAAGAAGAAVSGHLLAVVAPDKELLLAPAAAAAMASGVAGAESKAASVGGKGAGGGAAFPGAGASGGRGGASAAAGGGSGSGGGGRSSAAQRLGQLQQLQHLDERCRYSREQLMMMRGLGQGGATAGALSSCQEATGKAQGEGRDASGASKGSAGDSSAAPPPATALPVAHTPAPDKDAAVVASSASACANASSSAAIAGGAYTNASRSEAWEMARRAVAESAAELLLPLLPSGGVSVP